MIAPVEYTNVTVYDNRDACPECKHALDCHLGNRCGRCLECTALTYGCGDALTGVARKVES